MKKMVDRVLDSGIVIRVEEEFVKRDLMTRAEWAAWFAEEEISEEQFVKEHREFKRPLVTE